MASTRPARKSTAAAAPAVEAEVVETASTEPTFKQIANAAIDEAAKQLGLEAKDRYKAQRAFGFIAIQLASEAGELDELIQAVVDGAGDLPAGFGLERSVAAPKAAPVKKAAAPKATAVKGKSAAAPAKPAARRRPTR